MIYIHSVWFSGFNGSSTFPQLSLRPDCSLLSRSPSHGSQVQPTHSTLTHSRITDIHAHTSTSKPPLKHQTVTWLAGFIGSVVGWAIVSPIMFSYKVNGHWYSCDDDDGATGKPLTLTDRTLSSVMAE